MRSVKEADVKGRRVLVRVDFNVPLKGGKIVDDKRIRAVLPTIEFLRKKRAKVVLCSHLGRPDGRVVDSLRLGPVAERLSKLLKVRVLYEPDCVGADIEEAVNSLRPGNVLLLENLRFYAGEEDNDVLFAQKLAGLADVFVNDAFGVSHRAHASVEAVTRFLPSYAGFLLQKEVDVLSSLLKSPKRPFVAILGGAKVSDKIGVIESLLKRVDAVLVGGAMMFTFFKALGYEVGKSKYEPDKVMVAKSLLKKGRGRIMLPIDVIIASSPKGKSKVVSTHDIPKNMAGFDIGPFSQRLFSEVVKRSRTVFWNGPLGLCEVPEFSKGTKNLARVISDAKLTSVVGGGDIVAVIEKLKLESKFSHVSTGGGASLEFIEGKKLPGIVALDKCKLK